MNRPRTLIVGKPSDYFVGKILRAVVANRFEPLPIDVLRYGPRPDESSGWEMHHAVPMPAWPPGVREFALNDLKAEVAPGGTGFDAFLRGYAKIAILSLNPANVDVIHYVLDHHPDLPLSILCMDDETDRHYLFHSERAEHPDREAELRAMLQYSPEVERAHQRVRRFFINPHPWETMLRMGRSEPPELVPWMPPLINQVAGVDDVRRQNQCYRVLLFVKPSVELPQFLGVAKALASGNSDRPLQIIAFRNDLPTSSRVEHATLLCYPYPLDEVAYHRIIASCHGVVINPRGGMSTIRDAVRYGLDVITPVDNLINNVVLTKDVGLEMTAVANLVIDDRDGPVARRRENNRAALARYEFAAIAAFRREYGID